jgi:hypothetical protein
MELGLLVEGGDVPQRVQAHLEALIGNDVIRRYAGDNRQRRLPEAADAPRGADRHRA